MAGFIFMLAFLLLCAELLIKEFFERKKLKSKLKLLKSASPKKTLLSLDLLNLYVINQISNKKEKNKKPQHVDICKETFFGGRDNGELPMSPITVPSKICLDDSEIISSQMPTIECRMNPDTLNYQSNQVSNNEDERDLTNEANRRIDFNTKFTKKNNRQEDIEQVKEINENKFSLQCSELHVPKLSMFDKQGDWFQTNSDICKSI